MFSDSSVLENRIIQLVFYNKWFTGVFDDDSGIIFPVLSKNMWVLFRNAEINNVLLF